jgi:hypothetical protein
MAPVLEVFPRRPLRLARDPKRQRRRLGLLAFAVVLTLPAAYWGWQSVRSAMLRADLTARGVRAADTMNAEGDCYSRRSRISGTERAIDCWLNLTYRLRPEEGGEIRTAPVHLEGAAPIFTPPAIYDPADPSRVMLEPELERAMTWSELLGPVFLLFLPALALIPFFAGVRRGLARAAARPDPVIVPIERMLHQARANRLYVHFRAPGGAKPIVDSFAGEAPLLVHPPSGSPPDQQWALALRGPGGRPYLLDSALAWLELQEGERRAVLAAAGGA